MSLVTLFTQFAHPMLHAEDFVGRGPVGNSFLWDATLIASVLTPAVIMTTTILLLIRRWQLPFGALTLLLGLNGLLMFSLWSGHLDGFYSVLAAPVLAGLVGDLLILWLKPSVERVMALRLLAFIVPLLYFLGFFIIESTIGNIWWTIHLWLGACFMAGIAGLGMSYLLAPPAFPAAE